MNELRHIYLARDLKNGKKVCNFNRSDIQQQNVPLSAAADIPSLPSAAVPPVAPAAVKNYQGAVQRELADIKARATHAPNQPNRKTKLNGSRPTTLR